MPEDATWRVNKKFSGASDAAAATAAQSAKAQAQAQSAQAQAAPSVPPPPWTWGMPRNQNYAKHPAMEFAQTPDGDAPIEVSHMRMTADNVARCFAPTLLRAPAGHTAVRVLVY